MNTPYWNIFISILINFGCSQPAEFNETFYDELTSHDESNETLFAELNKPSENLSAIGYEITHFNDTNVQVRNTL